MNRNKVSRRDILKTAMASAALFVPARVLGREGPPPSERVNIGIIGLGGRARQIVGTCKLIPQINIVAVCDCLAPRCDSFVASKGEGLNWNQYVDFREMIDKENLDGVMVETTTHARAWVVIQAMQAGMDTYIEKPMSLTIAEGRQMVNAARKYNSVTQIGTQQRSMPMNNWASDLVKNGAIGKIHTVLAPNFVGPNLWPGKPAQPLPAGGDERWWDIWTNQAEMRPYHRDLHLGWMEWRDYDSGGLCYGVTGWGTHSYDQIQRALGTDETGPVEILLEEPVKSEPCGKFETRRPDATSLGYLLDLAKPVSGPRAKIRMKYANGTELRLHLDGDWGPGLGAIFIGDKGKIEINRNKISGNPKELINASDNPGPNKKNENQYHVENWIDCIKTRKRCNADIEYGQRSSTLCYLVNIVRDVGQVGKKLRWDPETELFTNSDEANTMLSRPRRKGYELPI
jgi:hypothetical protein